MNEKTKPPFEAFQGNEPYIFVSYAHSDSVLVYPEILKLHKKGYRVWYDEGIDPGNEWAEDIASALENCEFFMVFISPDAANSKNVRNEINFALNRDKAFLAVHIRETKLTSGMELRMGDIQAIMKYQVSDDFYFKKLCKALPSSLLFSQKNKPDKPSSHIVQKRLTNIVDRPFKNYNVVYTGHTLSGFKADDVQKKIAKQFKTNAGKISHLFSGNSIIIRKAVNYKTALNIVKVFERAGAVAVIKSADDNTKHCYKEMLQSAMIFEASADICNDRAEIYDYGAIKFMLIADGAGGFGGGKEAADLFVENMNKYLDNTDNFLNPQHWEGAFRNADQAILLDHIAGETTGIVIAIKDNHICGAGAGDSQVWLFAPSAQKYSELTCNQYRYRLGSGRAVPVGFGPLPFQGILVAASDGLFNYTTLEKISKIALNLTPKYITEALISIVRLDSGQLHDDVSVIVSKGNMDERDIPDNPRIRVSNRIEVIQGNIAEVEADAIVSPFGIGGGAFTAIQKAVGQNFLDAYHSIEKCHIGKAEIVRVNNLPAQYVIFSHGPVYSGRFDNFDLLTSCYQTSLELAVKHDLSSIALPAISCGINGFPINIACKIAVNTVWKFLENNESIRKVIFVMNTSKAYDAYKYYLSSYVNVTGTI
ncbi:macro domain-containing protein [Desulfobacterales bacterium HSG17]|nr:macro domain-containing protein [Desulfobacterales bacterium HSG17]